MIAAKVVSTIQTNFVSLSLSLQILTRKFFHQLYRRAGKEAASNKLALF
jgi:hypothetical protein